MAHIALMIVVAALAAWQLWRVPRVWAFLLLFIVLAPKIALTDVPGNTTPIRIDDLVIAAVLAWWLIGPARPGRPAKASRAESDLRDARPPASPVTFFILLYWSTVLVCTALGVASLTTAPLTGVLHVARTVEYGLLYYVFYSTIQPSELDDVVEVFRSTLLLVCGVWVAQHWTHAPVATATPWATLYPTFSATYDFGGYLMLATAMLYALWTIGRRRDPWTTAALLAGAFVTANSDARAALLGFATVIVVDIVVCVRWRAAIAGAALAAAAPYVIKSPKMLTLVTAVKALFTSFDASVITNAFLTDRSLALRLRNWRVAMDHWLARPLVGDGLGGYLQYTRQYDQPASLDGWYVRVLADSGLVGLLAFVLLVGALLWALFRAFRLESAPLRRAIVYGAALGVVAASVSAVLVDAFVSYKIMGVFWMMVGAGTRLAAAHQAAGDEMAVGMSPAASQPA